jgi:hypothetical protein
MPQRGESLRPDDTAAVNFQVARSSARALLTLSARRAGAAGRLDAPITLARPSRVRG